MSNSFKYHVGKCEGIKYCTFGMQPMLKQLFKTIHYFKGHQKKLAKNKTKTFKHGLTFHKHNNIYLSHLQ